MAEVWPLADEFITKACEGSEYASSDLLGWAVNGHSQLWFAWSDHLEAAAVTQIFGDVLIIQACGGKDMDRWLGLLDDIERWGAMQGCKTSRIYGRKGWARKLPDYKTSRVILDKAL